MTMFFVILHAVFLGFQVCTMFWGLSMNMRPKTNWFFFAINSFGVIWNLVFLIWHLTKVL